MAKYRLYLKTEEREVLHSKIGKYKNTAQNYLYAQILLHSDENMLSEKLTATAIASRFGISEKTVERVRKRFCLEGMGLFTPTVRKTRSDKKYDARVEAHLIELCCETPPNGLSKWTTQLLCDALVVRGVVESAALSAVCTLLKKTNLSPFKKSNM